MIRRADISYKLISIQVRFIYWIDWAVKPQHKQTNDLSTLIQQFSIIRKCLAQVEENRPFDLLLLTVVVVVVVVSIIIITDKFDCFIVWSTEMCQVNCKG